VINWKGPVVAHFNALFHHLPGGSEEQIRKPQWE